MHKRIISVTGTPGTGKTTLSKELAKALSYSYVDINKIIEKYNLSEGFDKEKQCRIVDTKKLSKALIRTIKCATKNLVIDGHLSHYLPLEWVDLCIVTRCRLKELKKRLEGKGYNEPKVRENMDAEIMDVCRIDAKENGHKVLEVNTTHGYDIGRIAKKIESL